MELLRTRKVIKKATAFILIVTILCGTMYPCKVEARNSFTLTIGVAKSLALANSEKLDELLLQYDQAQVKYKSAVKSAYEKYRYITVVQKYYFLWKKKMKEQKTKKMENKKKRVIKIKIKKKTNNDSSLCAKILFLMEKKE